MKLTIAFLALLVGVAVGQWARPIADQDFLDRQHSIYKLLTRPHLPIEDAEIREIGNTYNPYRFANYYNVPEQHIQQYVQQVEQGQILHRGVAFNVLDDAHRREMVTLFQLLHQARDWETFHKTAAWARQRVNEYMFVYAYTTALLHRADSQNFKIPPTYEILPGNYFTPEVLRQAFGTGYGYGQNGVVIPTTFAYKYYNPEQRYVAYHTEDVGMGQLHEVFHKQFPFWNCQNQERQGELFHHFIQQTLARYNQARLSNYMPFEQRFNYGRQYGFPGEHYGNYYGYPEQHQEIEGVKKVHGYTMEKEVVGQKYGYGYPEEVEGEKKVRGFTTVEKFVQGQRYPAGFHNFHYLTTPIEKLVQLVQLQQQQGLTTVAEKEMLLQRMQQEGQITPIEKEELMQQVYRQHHVLYTIEKIAYLNKLHHEGVISQIEKEQMKMHFEQKLEMQEAFTGRFEKEQIVRKVIEQQGAISPIAKVEVLERLHQQGIITPMEKTELLQKVERKHFEKEQGYPTPVDQMELLETLERQGVIGPMEKVEIHQQIQQQYYGHQYPAEFYNYHYLTTPIEKLVRLYQLQHQQNLNTVVEKEMLLQRMMQEGQITPIEKEELMQQVNRQHHVLYTIEKIAYLNKLHHENVISQIEKEQLQQHYEQKLQMEEAFTGRFQKEQIVRKVIEQQASISPIAKVEVLERLQQQGVITPLEMNELLQKVQRKHFEKQQGYPTPVDQIELLEQLERQGVIGPMEKVEIQQQIQQQQQFYGFPGQYHHNGFFGQRYPAEFYNYHYLTTPIEKLVRLYQLQHQQGLNTVAEKEMLLQRMLQEGQINPIEKEELMQQVYRQHHVLYTLEKIAYLNKLHHEGVISQIEKEQLKMHYEQKLQMEQVFTGRFEKEQIVRKVIEKHASISPIAKVEVLERLQQQGVITPLEKIELLQKVQRKHFEKQQGYPTPVDQMELLETLERHGVIGPMEKVEIQQHLQQQYGFPGQYRHFGFPGQQYHHFGFPGQYNRYEFPGQYRHEFPGQYRNEFPGQYNRYEFPGQYHFGHPEEYQNEYRYPVEKMEQIKQWERRIQEAIDTGYARDVNGQNIYFNQTHGMDVLGKMIQACEDSANPTYYGSLRNALHMLLEQQQQRGYPVNDFHTYVRDPAYYRIAELVNQLGHRFQSYQTPYTREELEFPGVQVETVEVLGEEETNPNMLTTYMDKYNVDMANAAEDNVISPVQLIEAQRLHHKSFQYVIKVRSTMVKKALVRIFMAPMYDHYGVEIPLTQQRHHYIEMDKFITVLKEGQTVIRRSSLESSIAVPETMGFKQMIEEVVAAKEGKTVFYVQENQPRCGIPQNLLLPRGTPEGMKFNLLVMVTDAEKEIVEHYRHQYLNLPVYKRQYQQQTRFVQQEKEVQVQQGVEEHYMPTYAQCGLIDGSYPFARSMGYPLDRPIHYYGKQAFQTLNMKFVEVVVKHVSAFATPAY